MFGRPNGHSHFGRNEAYAKIYRPSPFTPVGAGWRLEAAREFTRHDAVLNDNFDDGDQHFCLLELALLPSTLTSLSLSLTFTSLWRNKLRKILLSSHSNTRTIDKPDRKEYCTYLIRNTSTTHESLNIERNKYNNNTQQHPTAWLPIFTDSGTWRGWIMTCHLSLASADIVLSFCSLFFLQYYYFHRWCLYDVCSSYPHGGWVMAGLIGSSLSAMAATMWGVSSCRFAFVDFTSDRGDFSDFYLDPTADGPPVQIRAGVGLFTWLEPFDKLNWSEGSCSGYTEFQSDLFADNTFEVARIFAVLSVLTGIGVFGWAMFLSCVSLGKYQVWMMSGIFGLETIFVSLTFLMFGTKLCKDLVSYQDETYTTDCTLDQGGLVVIAAILLWCVACLISVIYIKPPESDMTFVNGQISNAFDNRRKERKLQMLLAQQKKEQAALRSKHASSKIQMSIDGEAEVQLGDSGTAAEI
jgi:hypothetical protein